MLALEAIYTKHLLSQNPSCVCDLLWIILWPTASSQRLRLIACFVSNTTWQCAMKSSAAGCVRSFRRGRVWCVGRGGARWRYGSLGLGGWHRRWQPAQGSATIDGAGGLRQFKDCGLWRVPVPHAGINRSLHWKSHSETSKNGYERALSRTHEFALIAAFYTMDVFLVTCGVLVLSWYKGKSGFWGHKQTYSSQTDKVEAAGGKCVKHSLHFQKLIWSFIRFSCKNIHIHNRICGQAGVQCMKFSSPMMLSSLYLALSMASQWIDCSMLEAAVGWAK